MAFPREILNELKWREGMDLKQAKIAYLHRGAPGDLMTISGADIVELGRSFFVTEESNIPYHRIRLITYQGKILYQSPELKTWPCPRDDNE